MRGPLPPSPPAGLLARTLRRRIWLPQEHGSWVFWLSPFVLGLCVGGAPGGGVAALFLGALAGFLLHQPAAVAVKVLSGRFPRSELAPALLAAGVLSLAGALAVPCLLAHHHPRVLLYVAPGVLLFAWHLALVARRDERRHPGLLLVTGGALALAAPAAYEVAGGADPLTPWVLAVLCWLRNAGDSATVYARLAQRAPSAGAPGAVASAAPASAGAPPGGAPPPAAGALRRMLAWNVAGVLAAGAGAAFGVVPEPVPLAFVLPAADALRIAATTPPRPLLPRQIGLHQLGMAVAFTLLCVLLWR